MSLSVSNPNATLIRWKTVDLKKQRDDAGGKGLGSNLFALSTCPSSIQFAFFIQHNGGLVSKNGVTFVLKKFGDDDKPVEASVKLWVESTTGKRFSKTFVKKHMFSKVDDYCGCNGISDDKDWNIFWQLYRSHQTFFICCELTDLNAHLFPTVGQYQEFYQNHLTFYERGMHDAVIKAGKTEFKIIKFVFMFQSEVFERMFTSNFNEAVTNEIKIDDIDEKTMKHFVKWFYTGKLEDGSSIDKLYSAADKYDVNVLKKMCADRMISTLTKDNAFNRLVLASMHSDTELETAILDFIPGLPSVNIADFFGSPEWLNFTSKSPEIADYVKTLICDKLGK